MSKQSEPTLAAAPCPHVEPSAASMKRRYVTGASTFDHIIFTINPLLRWIVNSVLHTSNREDGWLTYKETTCFNCFTSYWGVI